MRLFLALPLSEIVIEGIDKWRTPLLSQYPNLRWTNSENLHLTLRFLGNREPAAVIREMEKLNLVSSLPVEYKLDRCGSFGSPASVLWLSGEFSDSCYRLASQLAAVADENGRAENRKFFPHITVARSHRCSEVSPVRFEDIIQGSSSEIRLISSTLTAQGPVYSELFRLSV